MRRAIDEIRDGATYRYADLAAIDPELERRARSIVRQQVADEINEARQRAGTGSTTGKSRNPQVIGTEGPTLNDMTTPERPAAEQGRLGDRLSPRFAPPT